MITPQSTTEIINNFQPLLEKFQTRKTRVITQSELAQQKQNQIVLKKVADYSVENIVNTLADLQLHFNSNTDSLAEKILQEDNKLDALENAIAIESSALNELKEIKVITESLDILKQEYTKQLEKFSEHTQCENKNLEQEIQRKKEEWDKDLQIYNDTCAEYDKNQEKSRVQNEDVYNYEQERKNKLADDQHQEKKLLLERELSEERIKKEKNWSERSTLLKQQEKKLTEYKNRVTEFSEKLKQESNKAREKAIQKINQEYKLEAELVEKENTANIELFEAKISALDNTIKKQDQQLQNLSQQLEKALQQLQDLAIKAVLTPSTK